MDDDTEVSHGFDPLPSSSNDGEVIYDATQLEELDHFDIGEDGANGMDMSSEDVSVWPSGEAQSKQNRSKTRGRGAAQVVHILNPRRMPSRQARVKSFKDLIEDNEEETIVESEVTSYTKEDAVSRVFIANDDPSQHLEWSLFSSNPESASVAAYILLTDASHVKPEQICSSVPQEFTGVGTFVVDMSGMRSRHELNLDALGSWGVPSGSTKFYHLNPATNRAAATTETNHAIRVLCNRYLHPGTDARGVFIKKTYTGFHRAGVPSPYGVIVYEWEGTPHPVSVAMATMPHQGSIKDKPFGSRSWEASQYSLDLLRDDGATFRGQPVFARVAVDFESACRILLATFVIPQHRICTRVPQQFRECGSFVLDVARCGGERAIGRDGREWNKPSGSSRFFRFDADGNAIRVGATTHTEDYDVQIFSKRYETTQMASLVRKIFIAKEREQPPRVNSHLAVVTYLYRPIHPEKGLVIGGKVSGQSRKRACVTSTDDAATAAGTSASTSTGSSQHQIRISPSDDVIEDDDDRNGAGGTMDSKPPRLESSAGAGGGGTSMSSDLFELKKMTLAKQIENQTRMGHLLDRAETFFDRFEQSGGDSMHLPFVRQLVQHHGTHEWVSGGNGGDHPHQMTTTEEVVVTSHQEDQEGEGDDGDLVQTVHSGDAVDGDEIVVDSDMVDAEEEHLHEQEDQDQLRHSADQLPPDFHEYEEVISP